RDSHSRAHGLPAPGDSRTRERDPQPARRFTYPRTRSPSDLAIHVPANAIPNPARLLAAVGTVPQLPAQLTRPQAHPSRADAIASRLPGPSRACFSRPPDFGLTARTCPATHLHTGRGRLDLRHIPGGAAGASLANDFPASCENSRSRAGAREILRLQAYLHGHMQVCLLLRFGNPRA